MKPDRCPCGDIVLAVTEDWRVPLCYDCYPKHLDDENNKLRVQLAIAVEALDRVYNCCHQDADIKEPEALAFVLACEALAQITLEPEAVHEE